MLVAARDEQGAPLSDQHLRDELLTLLLGGHETTATSLAWAFLQVLNRPDVLARLRAEVATAAGPDGRLEPERVVALPYLDATLKESLRLWPIVPVVVRKAKRTMTIGGVTVPEGVMVAPAIYLTHRRRDVWGDRGVPARALPRAQGRPVRALSLRRRDAPVPRDGLRALRDAHRARRGDPPRDAPARAAAVRRVASRDPRAGAPVVLEARRPAAAPIIPSS